jgi:hypothetical protein
MLNKRISVAISLVATMLLTACVSPRMYEGPERSKAEIGRFFTHGGNRKLQIVSLDGKPYEFMAPKALQMAPGPHVFEVDASNYWERGVFIMPAYVSTASSKSFDVGTYRIEVPIRAGYTYVFDFALDYVGPLPDKLCILEEPHDAPGSSENYTGEFRTMSPKATAAACGPQTKTRHYGP